MNLPNKLTTLRVILIPFFVVFYTFNTGVNRYIALIIFIAASITDFLDGYIARKYNLVSNFGKLMDPLADKLLVCAALVVLSVEGRVPVGVTLIIISREFIVSGFRQLAAEQGIVMAAGYIGKFKTTFQMIFIILMIWGIDSLQGVADICMWIAVALTIISMIDYVWKNKSVLK